jgi:ubiquinone/menaquinone biosynthesis C-methylase UbiE
MSIAAGPGTETRSVLERLSEGVCRRAFSSPEALLYELTIAVALCRVVEPVLGPHLRGKSVLDVGCGGGRLAVAIAHGTQRTVVGLDPSMAQVRRFTRRGTAACPAVRGQAETLPFRTASFDSVYSSCVFKHWLLPANGLSECARVTRPGGEPGHR